MSTTGAPTRVDPGRLDPRLAAAVLAGQLTGALSRRLKLGGGTTLPGRVTGWIDRDSPAKIAGRLRNGVVLVTATNGKTTTTRLISQILRAAHHRVVHNRSGANLVSGVTSTLIAAAAPSGRTGGDIGLFEVDEASVPEVARLTAPRLVVVGNLFRDQLDRYGEVTYVVGAWRRAIAALPAASSLILNADDPNVAALTEAGRATTFIGVDVPGLGGDTLEHTADARLCPHCGARLAYTRVYFGHIGHYACPGCGWARPRPDIAAVAIAAHGADGSTVDVRLGEGSLRVRVPLPGLYNVYNALTALAAALSLGISAEAAGAEIARFAGAFGRIERIAVGDRCIYMALIKNPVGFNQVLRALIAPIADADVMIAINDNLADGTDVSWLWDVDCEPIRDSAARVTVSGTRAEDMALRLKYEDVPLARVSVRGGLVAALDDALAATPPGGTLYVLPTYTAMLELRSELADRGLVVPFWEE